MLNEHIHQELADIYDEFDRHSRITKADYSIDADYPYLQGYTLLKCPDFDGFIRHIANYVKSKPVDFRVNGVPVQYEKIERLPRRRHNVVTFAVTPIQENEREKWRRRGATVRNNDSEPHFVKFSPKKFDRSGLSDEDSNTSPWADSDMLNLDASLTPEQKEARRIKRARELEAEKASEEVIDAQARGDYEHSGDEWLDKAFDKDAYDERERTEKEWGMSRPSQLGENQYKYPDTKMARDNNPKNNSRNANFHSAFKESSFDDRFYEAINEQVKVTFTEPDVLFTQTTHATSPEEAEAEAMAELEGLKEECRHRINKYMSIIESSSSELTVSIAENMVEDLTKHVNLIEGIINERTP